MTVRFLKAAQEELREAVRFYNAQRPGLGTAFRDEVRATVERIMALPDAWHILSASTRRCRTHRFPYGVLYQVRGNEIVIVAVAHLHQEPGHWTDRL